jgi:hypothetical protein
MGLEALLISSPDRSVGGPGGDKTVLIVVDAPQPKACAVLTLQFFSDRLMPVSAVSMSAL